MVAGWAMSQSMAELGGENKRMDSESTLSVRRLGTKGSEAYDGYNLNGLRTAAVARCDSAPPLAAAAPRGDMGTSIPRTCPAHGS